MKKFNPGFGFFMLPKAFCAMIMTMISPIMFFETDPNEPGGGTPEEKMVATITKKMEDLTKKATDGLITKGVYDAKVKEIGDKMDTLGTDVDVKKVKDDLKTLQDQVDATDIQIQKGNIYPIPFDLKASILKALEGEDYQMYLSKDCKQNAPADMPLMTKAGDMSSGGNLTGVVLQPDQRPGIVAVADRLVNIRDWIAKGTTVKDKIDFVKEANYDDGVDMKAEVSASGQSDFDLVDSSVNVERMTTYFTVSRNMLDDLGYLAAHIANRAPKKMRNKEDQQILFGTGSTPQIEGITGVAASFAPTGLQGDVEDANKMDVFRAAVSQLNVAYYMVSLIIIHPYDSAGIDMHKDANGNYSITRLMTVDMSGNKRFMTIPVIETTAMTAGKYLIGDFNLGAELVDRKGITMTFSDSHASNFTSNKRTILFEERIALPIYRDESFIYGTFEDDIAYLLKA